MVWYGIYFPYKKQAINYKSNIIYKYKTYGWIALLSDADSTSLFYRGVHIKVRRPIQLNLNITTGMKYKQQLKRT